MAVSFSPRDAHRTESAANERPETRDGASIEPAAADFRSLRGAPSSRSCAVELLIDGPEAYDAMLASIDGADTSILLESYIFADDHIGRRFADALEKARRRGVSVHVIYDSFGSGDSAEAFFGRLTDAGVHVVEYNHVSWWKALRDPLRLNRRNHRKLLVVDGRAVFVGGINLARTYTRSSLRRRKRRKERFEKAWRDTHMCIEGPIVAAFHDAFIRHWRSTSDRPEPSALEKTPAAAGDDSVYMIDSAGGRRTRSPIRIAYEEAICAARQRVWITQAYCVPDERLFECLAEAAGRGADVRLLVAGPTDSFLARYSSNACYQAMLDAGIRLYEFKRSILHAKTAVIDGYWSTVGSSNLDQRSAYQNDELNAVVLSASFAEKLESLFEQDIESAREISGDAWRRRGPVPRVLEGCCSLAARWI